MISFVTAEAANEVRYWNIEHYDIKAVMDKDGILTVEERITAHFHGQYHGILKTISASKDVRKIKCSEPFVVETENGDLIIRIGNADTTVTGVVEYILSYEMNPKMIREFVYTIPGEWSVDIQDLEFSLTVPGGRFYECSISSFDGMPAGKTFETTEDAEGNLIIRCSANQIPAWGYLELMLRR